MLFCTTLATAGGFGSLNRKLTACPITFLYQHMFSPPQKSETRQAAYKHSLNVKLELTGLLQEIVQDRLAAPGAPGADAQRLPAIASIVSSLDDLRAGKEVSHESIVAVAKMFKDDITLESMPRGQVRTGRRAEGGGVAWYRTQWRAIFYLLPVAPAPVRR